VLHSNTLDSESNPYDKSLDGVWFEFEGDFRTIGDLPGATAAYESAIAVYEQAGNPSTGAFEQFHFHASALIKLLFDSTAVERDPLNSVLAPGTTSLSEWIEFKQTYLPTLITEIAESDEWVYPYDR
jgi:hypothetical protein